MTSDPKERIVLDQPRVGLLFPGSSSVDDYFRMSLRFDPEVTVHVATTPIPDGGARVQSSVDGGSMVRGMGSEDNLRYGANQLRDAPPLTAVAWACTSCSFMWGYEGTRRQAALLSELTGAPATTTSLAIEAALRHIGVNRVAIASPYPTMLTTEFERYLDTRAFEVVSTYSLDLPSVAEMAALDADAVYALVEAADQPAAEAIVIPETGLHTGEILDRLEERANKPVVTANQATLWHALRLGGYLRPQPGFGRLFLN